MARLLPNNIEFSALSFRKADHIQVSQKELFYGIPNVAVWRVLRERLHSKATLTTQKHLEYHCRVLFETSCITSGSHIEP
jgi:hypothetical protein